MPLIAKSPEEVKADRLAREARDKENAEEKFLGQRALVSGLLQILGGVLLVIGVWFLLFSPGIVSDVVNVQRLYIGQTSAIVGAILLATGLLLKYLS